MKALTDPGIHLDGKTSLAIFQGGLQSTLIQIKDREISRGAWNSLTQVNADLVETIESVIFSSTPSWKSIMSLVLEQLYRDHRNMRQLLDVIEILLGDRTDRPSADVELLRDVMEYTLNFPDLVHHPRENLIYNRVVARDPFARDGIGDLVAEHAVLTAKARGVAEALRFIWQDGELSRDWFKELVQDYVDTLRKHMESEEQGVFQLALRKLDNVDWLSIDMAANNPATSSLIQKSEERYLTLHGRIMRLAA